MSLSVVVLMSGGVDSSVSALLLKEQGYRVLGVTYKLSRGCGNNLDLIYAYKVANSLGIEHKVIDLSAEFEKEIIQYFLDEYKEGRTPNPCAFCNAKIKIKYGVELAKAIGYDLVATGHYAKIEMDENGVHLKKAKWLSKSQEYYLSLVPKKYLEKLIFPLGELSKDEVKAIAVRAGLEVYKRQESQDICFVGSDYRYFLKSKGFPEVNGQIVDEHGNYLGMHEGYYFYTVGQRRGSRVAGGKRMYVKKIDPHENKIVLAPFDEVLQTEFYVRNLNIIEDFSESESLEVRVRYRGELAEGSLIKVSENWYKVKLNRPLFAITPGQVAAFYRGDAVIAGGIIDEFESN